MAFITAAVEKFAHDHTKPESDLYQRLRDETYETMRAPQMQVGRIEGKFLKLLVQLAGARNVLEIGMFTGYSALMMAEGLPNDGRLVTCDIDPQAEVLARRYFAESPHGHKIEVRMGTSSELDFYAHRAVRSDLHRRRQNQLC
jgi:predicted O-methyltransferase YrrM